MQGGDSPSVLLRQPRGDGHPQDTSAHLHQGGDGGVNIVRGECQW